METAKLIAGILVILLGLPLLIVWLKDKLFKRLPSKAEMSEFSRHFQPRLLHPDFNAIEAHFGCSMPEELKRLYADQTEILRGEFEAQPPTASSQAKWYVAYYNPADAESLKDIWPDTTGYFSFANDGCGNDYLIDPRNPTMDVLFYDHETGEFTQVGMNLNAFLSAGRKQPL